MKYYRLVFRSQDRMAGSTYTEPYFIVDLPSNAFGDTRAKTCKVILENFDGYAQKQASKAYHQIEVDFKDVTIQNEIATTGDSNFSVGKHIAYIPSIDRTGSDIYYHLDNFVDYEKIKGLVVPCSAFSNSRVGFKLHHLGDVPIVEPSAAELRFYNLTLGVYVE